MNITFDIDGFLDELKENAGTSLDSELLDDVIASLREYGNAGLIEDKLNEIYDGFDFNNYTDSLSKEISSKLLLHGEKAVKDALFSMIPSSLILIALIAKFTVLVL
ncbi:hypothetical protein FWP33_17025 [Vibrio parahaemolyticus]|uniref:Uncharacterized protein n=2 Tax=Vibrio harveyi group TaxID=717610 RepID=A0A9Q3UAT9_VIBPH|nr:hypothetical protein [Vibrio parahaemolyticus]ELA8176808.1 hypothetical protein [Vibrio alginolyticus]CAH1593071.1 hypothetical protein THF1C08_320098 [Vibrio jasicida]EGQ9744204.1 hypothetical protein [Vibrio parahaemolyticus]EJC7176240.1 hypothetical protein [Vibrio parahaemolyticus]EJE4724685.1 hypothetical protein [Vibrio parahaemolyticus]